MEKVKINDSVRLLEFPKGDINEYARVKHIYPDNRVWLVPYCGSINEIYSQEEFEKMTGLKI